MFKFVAKRAFATTDLNIMPPEPHSVPIVKLEKPQPPADAAPPANPTSMEVVVPSPPNAPAIQPPAADPTSMEVVASSSPKAPAAPAPKRRFIAKKTSLPNAARLQLLAPPPKPKPAAAPPTEKTEAVKEEEEEEEEEPEEKPDNKRPNPTAGMAITVSKRFAPTAAQGSALAAQLQSLAQGRAANATKNLRPSFDPLAEDALVLYAPPEGSEGEVHIVMDPFLSAKLRPHQVEGCKFITSALLGQNRLGMGCVLADDMGLGKTLQTIATLYTLLHQGRQGAAKPEALNVCIICPATLCFNWANEFTKWLCSDGQKRIEPMVITSDTKGGKQVIENRLRGFAQQRRAVLITSYETARNYIDCLKMTQFGLLVCDEAHRLKNPETALYKALHQLKTKMRLVVTGTPIQNDLNEYFALIDFTVPKGLGERKAFDAAYSRHILRARDLGANEKERALGQKASTNLTGLVNEILLRRTNEVIAKYLPAKLDAYVFCTLTPEQRGLYEQVVAEQLKQYESSATAAPNDSSSSSKAASERTTSSALQTVARLKAIINDPEAAMRASQQRETFRFGADEGGGGGGGASSKPQAPNAAESLRLSGKLQALLALLDEVKRTSSDRFVLISNYTSTLNVFESLLKARNFSFKRLDGSMDAKKRQEVVDVFNEDRSWFCFLLSSKAGGCGINLIGANRLVLFDPDWNPAIDAQALARVWRSGQQRPCFNYRFMASGSLEEVCLERQCSKEGLAKEMIDGDGDSRRFSEEELRSLLTPEFGIPSLFHMRSGCVCCMKQPGGGGAPKKPKLPDDSGYVHLEPGTDELRAADPALARAADASGRVALCYTRVTDASGRGFVWPDHTVQPL